MARCPELVSARYFLAVDDPDSASTADQYFGERVGVDALARALDDKGRI